MNWYRKFVKLANRNPLDMDAIAISNIIFMKIKNIYLSGELKSQTINFYPNRLQNQYRQWNSLAESFLSMINIVIETLNINDDFNIGGNYDGANNNINIFIKINKNTFSKKIFKSMYMNLFEVVRHEIRHLYDSNSGKNINTQRVERQVNLVNYAHSLSGKILSETESQAYIDGIVLKAKRDHQPFSRLVILSVSNFFASYLGNYKQNKALTKEDILQIQQIEGLVCQTLIQRAQQKYPKLQ